MAQDILICKIYTSIKQGCCNGHKVGRQGRRAGLNNVPAFTANIYAEATNITNINNKIVI
jgi:hypothetical protein